MHVLETPEVDIAYDVHGPLPTADGRPPLLMIAQPMDARGFATLASYFPDRTVVTYDPRGLGRSIRRDGRVDSAPEAAAAERARAGVRDAYEARGSGAGMAAFIAMTSWRGEFSDDYFAQLAPDPAQFGMPSEDDGSRDDPLLSDRSSPAARRWPPPSSSAKRRPCSRATTAASWAASSATRANPRPSRTDCATSSTTTPDPACELA